MILRRLVIAVLGIALFSSTAVGADEGASAARPVKKVLVIGIDGCRFDALRAADAPHLDSLIEHGALAEPIRIFPAHFREADTCSGPGWSNVLCGVWPDKHRVMDNEFTAPKYADFPHFFTRLKQAQPEAFTASFSNWAPIAQFIVQDADVKHDASGEEKPYEEGDAENALAASELLRDGDPTATVVYLGQVDEVGHVDGFHPSVPNYIASIERVDGHVGQLLDAIAARKTRDQEDWLVLVTTDHGGSGTGHGGGHDNPEVACSWLIVNGAAAAPGKIAGPCGQVDLVPTALAHLGVDVDPAWKLDGRAVGLLKKN